MKQFLFMTAFLCTTIIGKLSAQNDAIKVLSNGNVGIGTETPAENLEVQGNIKTNGRLLDKTGIVMPVGTVLPFAGTTPPPGWLLCNGSSYSISGDQKDLYATIGFKYGSDGADKFKVPDLSGTFIQGAGPESLGTRGEPDQHSHTVTMPDRTFYTSNAGNHSHRFPDTWYYRKMDSGKYTSIDTNGDDVKNQSTQESGLHNHSVFVSTYSMYSTTSTDRNRPKWITLNYIIKY